MVTDIPRYSVSAMTSDTLIITEERFVYGVQKKHGVFKFRMGSQRVALGK